MRENANEGDPASEGISELLKALAASVERNERMQEEFRNAVVRRLARIEARSRVLQLCDIVNSRKWGPVDEAVKQEAGYEALVSELSEELERKMFKETSVGRDGLSETVARRGRRRKWWGWEI